MKNANVKTEKTIVALPEFDAYAKTIIKAEQARDTAEASTRDAIAYAMNSFIDQCHKAGLTKTQADVEKISGAIMNSQPIVDAIALGLRPRKTFTEYASGAKRAFFHGVAWYATLKNDPNMGLPWGGAKGEKKSSTGKVITTTRAELDKTISKALEQARALGLLNFAAELVDLAAESLDGFTE